MVSKKLKNASNSSAAVSDSSKVSNIEKMTKEQLKDELKKRGMKVSGTKNNMLQRLGSVMATVKRKGEIIQANGQTDSRSQRTNSKMQQQRREDERAAREKIVLWFQPITTLKYFSRQLSFNIRTGLQQLLQHKLAVAAGLLSLASLILVLHLDGPHQFYLIPMRKQVLWCLYWLGLGVLSSVGLGTGLHTFVLYLGPHIASVTLAAYECNSLDFPEPPYPDEIICPDNVQGSGGINIFQIMAKVRLEAMMWGAGTALGELPPYFMARAARLSGYDPEDEDDLREFEELQLKKNNPSSMSAMDRAKLTVEKMVEKVGFLGILACASIPNPLFDLAGITCGHFLVPFWTFFGATLLGKAVIKMHIQKMFVIIAFNERLLEEAVALMSHIPYVGRKLQEPFKEFLENQKHKLHRRSDASVPTEGGNLLGWVFEKLVIAMILYFVVSIINSLAQSYHKRLCKERRPSKHAKD